MIGFKKRTAQHAGDGHLRLGAPLSVVVVGGGIAGVAAATVLAERGAKVTLVEAERFLGGRAGAWTEELPGGEPYEMERGFHGFFRQYYNLRDLLRRVDPTLSFLTPLTDYPLLGPGGRQESFSNLPRLPMLNVASLVRRSQSLGLRDLPKVGARSAMAMLTFDPAATYARFDDMTAGQYLDSLKFPPDARQMLFDVFSHSFFNPEDRLSAAELLMNFHFYFMGNPEGLVFDVMNEPFSTAFWDPMGAYLERLGVDLRMGVRARLVERREAGFTVGLGGAEAVPADAVVLAVHVPALKRIVAASPGLGDAAWRSDIDALDVTSPFAVLRLWLDRRCDASRPPFAGTAGVGMLDNISIYDLFEGESERWARKTGGTVVELHAYAVPDGATEEEIRADLLSGLHHFYPESRAAKTLHERFLLRQDCPSFAPGSHARRPTVQTPVPGLMLAGDFVRTPFPSALMERATATGFMAANEVFGARGVARETVWSVPPRGLLSSFARPRRAA